ncbi:MAG: succinate dehydrogenase iron-sulfur subunit [Gammaproteobacteria bacterium]|nr:MAG: succinate dehydrogenase iron-sulfur subunit [Gammaproteobacteria bacterium]
MSSLSAQFKVYRFNPERDDKPHFQYYNLSGLQPDTMLLDILLKLKEQDPTLSFRHSCGEGVCGSDGIHVNGKNCLGCITSLADIQIKEGDEISIAPLPGFPVIRDLVVDLTQFFKQYRAARPWLSVKDPIPEIEHLQTPEQRKKLDGLYECILCACCSAACPSYWWNPDKFLGPAALLQAARFIEDSRDQYTEERLQSLNDAYKLFRCHTIMNCSAVCPKHLNPTQAIGKIKQKMLSGQDD